MSQKTKMIGIRVEIDYQDHLRAAAADFGWSISEAVIMATNAHFQYSYDRRRKYLEGIRDDMVDGPRKREVEETIAKAKRATKYFRAQQDDLEAKASLYKEIETLEAYRGIPIAEQAQARKDKVAAKA